jgi:hypothetical protein
MNRVLLPCFAGGCETRTGQYENTESESSGHYDEVVGCKMIEIEYCSFSWNLRFEYKYQ